MDSYCSIPQNPNAPLPARIEFFKTNVELISERTAINGQYIAQTDVVLPFIPKTILAYAGGHERYLQIIEWYPNNGWSVNYSTYATCYDPNIIRYTASQNGIFSLTENSLLYTYDAAD